MVVCCHVCMISPVYVITHVKTQVDKIIDQLQQFIQNYDLVGLKEYWSYLDHRLFSRLEDVYRPTVNKLRTSLFRYYLVCTVQVGDCYVSIFWASLNEGLKFNSRLVTHNHLLSVVDLLFFFFSILLYNALVDTALLAGFFPPSHSDKESGEDSRVFSEAGS